MQRYRDGKEYMIQKSPNSLMWLEIRRFEGMVGKIGRAQ